MSRIKKLVIVFLIMGVVYLLVLVLSIWFASSCTKLDVPLARNIPEECFLMNYIYTKEYLLFRQLIESLFIPLEAVILIVGLIWTFKPNKK